MAENVRNGLEYRESTGSVRIRLEKRKKKLSWAAIIAGALTTLGGAGTAVVQQATSRSQIAAAATVEERVRQHDRELRDIHEQLAAIAASQVTTAASIATLLERTEPVRMMALERPPGLRPR